MSLNAKQQKIAYYLGQGLRPAQVAEICGVTLAYISQLVKPGEGPEGFREEVERHALAAQENNDEEKGLDVKYLAAEHQALKAVMDGMASGDAGMLNAQVNALKAIADRQDKRLKRQMPVPQGPNGTGGAVYNITQIMLPSHALRAPQVAMNSQKQIIAVEGQAMAPMTSSQVKSLFSGLKAGIIAPRAQEYEAAQVIEENYHEQSTSTGTGSPRSPDSLPGPRGEPSEGPRLIDISGPEF